MANPFSVAVPNALESLLLGEQSYTQGVKARQEERKRSALSQLLQGGDLDPKRAAGVLVANGDTAGAVPFLNLASATERNKADDAWRRQEAERSSKQWAASHALAVRSANRADEDQFQIVKVDNPDGTSGVIRVRKRGDEGPIAGAAPTSTDGGNPFGAGKFNEGQGKAAGFSDRMLGAEAILSGRAAETGIGPVSPGVDVQGASVSGRYGSKVPVIGNFINTEPQQKFNQARDDFINAQLRRESGAAIGASEYANADRQYFPMPGDTPQVIEQKRRNRETAIKAMGREGGPSYRPENLLNEGGGVRSARPKIAPAVQATSPANSTGPNGDAIMQQARDAIQRGADPRAVAQRLRDNGIDPSGI